MRRNRIIPVLAAVLFFTGCSDRVPTVSLGIDETYYVARMQKLELHPALTGEEYRWYMTESDGGRILLSESHDFIFLAAKEGTYSLEFEIIDPETPCCYEFTVHVLHEEVEYSPYISKVLEYCPAPGQFVNLLPVYEEGDSYSDILDKCTECISGTNDEIVTLGAYGGFITFAFDHTVVNKPGEMDLRIWGNAFYQQQHSDIKGGSAEPGIVCVSYDVNCNGLPDDPWYELAGSDYHKASTLHDYSIIYKRPDSDRDIVSDKGGLISDKYYIEWTDSEGASGYLAHNKFHPQEYFPLWVNDDIISFTGSCLEPNGSLMNGNYLLRCLDWGYADNHPNEYFNLNSFDISWAVDDFGLPVDLPGVDFVRVYTGVNQYCGSLGETSTEICRAQDLHVLPKSMYE